MHFRRYVLYLHGPALPAATGVPLPPRKPNRPAAAPAPLLTVHSPVPPLTSASQIPPTPRPARPHPRLRGPSPVHGSGAAALTPHLCPGSPVRPNGRRLGATRHHLILPHASRREGTGGRGRERRERLPPAPSARRLPRASRGGKRERRGARARSTAVGGRNHCARGGKGRTMAEREGGTRRGGEGEGKLRQRGGTLRKRGVGRGWLLGERGPHFLAVFSVRQAPEQVTWQLHSAAMFVPC